MTILKTQAELRDAKHEDGLCFQCCECNQVKPVHTNGGTGYGYPPKGEPNEDKPVCYACCAEADKRRLESDDRITLYLVKGTSWEITNWPGTLRFSAYVQTGRHNIARTRFDAWFTDHTGRKWHGVMYGNNTQLCHCRKLKS